MENTQKRDYAELKAAFQDPQADNRLHVYFPISLSKKNFGLDEQDLSRYSTYCQKNGIGCIIPERSPGSGDEPITREQFRSLYRQLLSFAETRDLSVGLNLQPDLQACVLKSLEDPLRTDLRARTLITRSYSCDTCENVEMTLHEGRLMSLVAVDTDQSDCIDLRPYLNGRELRWQAPPGNWQIVEYLCVPCTESDVVNYLNYDASRQYLETVYEAIGDLYRRYDNGTSRVLCYPDICYQTRNRRDWDEQFNEYFEKKFGYDPAPYYPVLFGMNMGIHTPHWRAHFSDCRGAMLRDGIMKALNEFSQCHGFTLFKSVAEPKSTASPWLSGDNMRNGSGPYGTGAVMDRSYLYGINSVKIAAAATYNYDHQRVSCEIFRQYGSVNPDVLYNDTMNAFARGANLLLTHLPSATKPKATPRNWWDFMEQEPEPTAVMDAAFLKTYTAFVRRMQALLRDGNHVADIALLYPIYSLHAAVTLYESRAEGFEYPATPDEADYMTVISSITTYSGHDLTVLHPTTLAKRCHTEAGVLYLDNEQNPERFRILVMPSSDMIRLDSMRLIADFYDGGGKIIATGRLPRRAYEFKPERDQYGDLLESEADREVQRLMEHVFGPDAVKETVILDHCYHANGNGGEAFFLYFSSTAADGTQMVHGKVINEAINAFSLPLDLYLPDMPRLECIGALNAPYREFKKLGLERHIPGGGLLNHLHKRVGGLDLYYFTNTTDHIFDSHVLLRGSIYPEEWNPHTGKIHKISDYETTLYQGELYTRIPIRLEPNQSTFFVSGGTSSLMNLLSPKEITKIDTIEGIQTTYKTQKEYDYEHDQSSV